MQYWLNSGWIVANSGWIVAGSGWKISLVCEVRSYCISHLLCSCIIWNRWRPLKRNFIAHTSHRKLHKWVRVQVPIWGQGKHQGCWSWRLVINIPPLSSGKKSVFEEAFCKVNFNDWPLLHDSFKGKHRWRGVGFAVSCLGLFNEFPLIVVVVVP